MLKNYKQGQKFVKFLAVRKSNVSTAKNGNTFLGCTLSDGETEVDAKQWDFEGTPPAENTVIKVEAVMDQYNGKPQLIIQRWRQAEPCECDPARFIPKCPIEPADMWQDLQHFTRLIKHQGLIELVDTVLEESIDDFILCPGAMTNHHAYLGGLLEHTLGVVEKALAISNDCNKDLLIAGSILHDVGKIHDYDWKGCTITMTDIGRLQGHIVTGSIMVDKYINRLQLDKDIGNALLHLIISHHGKFEWGSPVEPAMKEAVILHTADMLDAQLWKITNAELEVAENSWTPKIYGINKEFYVPKKIAQAGA